MKAPRFEPSLPSLPKRPRDSHKGTFGRVLVVAGTPGMAGACALAARGALRAGSGLVTLAIPLELGTALGILVPEATQVFLPAAEGNHFEEELSAFVHQRVVSRFDALVVGPGLGHSPASAALVNSLMKVETPQVVDADGLNLIAEHSIAAPPSAHRVWTPHPGEFRRLTGESPIGNDERVLCCARFVAQRKGVVVLKGYRTVILDGDRYGINLTGNSGLATGGSGDVLAGIIGSFLGQGLAPFAAARLGVHVHGLAGDVAARRLGEASVTAGDVTESLPEALQFLSQ